MPISASQDGVTVKTRRNTAGTPKDGIRIWSGVSRPTDDLDCYVILLAITIRIGIMS